MIFLDCNHNMHRECLYKYAETHMNCPICRKSLIDPHSVEEYYDLEFASTPMPSEFRNARMNIHCNDCSQKSVVPFHVLGGKCVQCRSYNTMRAEGTITYVDSSEEDESQGADA